MKIIPTIFEQNEIRRAYDEKTETWWFSVVDIVQVLTQQHDSQKARKYRNKLKERLQKEGSELVTDCHQLKFKAPDGKFRSTDVATAETLLRLSNSLLNNCPAVFYPFPSPDRLRSQVSGLRFLQGTVSGL